MLLHLCWLIYNLYNPALVESMYVRPDQYLLSSLVNIVTKTLGCLLHLCAFVARRMNTGLSSQRQKLRSKEFANGITAHFCLLLHLLRHALSTKPPGYELQMLYCGLVERSCCFGDSLYFSTSLTFCLSLFSSREMGCG